MRSLALVSSLTLALMAPALAQDGPGTDVQSYAPVFFDRFAPQTALDMLSQVPGFSIRSTGGGRGLGQGGTNILINGERVTSKDTGVTDILARTPVSNVVRIEVASAASLGVTGLSGQVANVVLERERVTGSWQYRTEFREETRPRLTNGAVSISGQLGRFGYTLGIENDSFRGFEAGPEEVLDAEGNLVELRREIQRSRGERPSVTMALDYELTPRTDVSLTGKAESYSFERREDSFRPGGELRQATNGEDEWNAELSLQVSHDRGPGTLNVIAYDRYERSPILDRTDRHVPGSPLGTAIFTRGINEGESIGRAEYAWMTPQEKSWELAGEVAFNFLDVESQLEERTGPDRVFEPLPDARVEEIRNQASITHGFTLGEDLAIQASAAGEYSKITVIGEEASSDQAFLRPKGYLTLAYPVTERLALRARIERSVGQLSFNDFVDAVDLREERERAGNAGLMPQQAWDGELEVQKSFGEDEQLVIRLTGSLIEDRVDRVLIDGRNAVGNIDQARAARLVSEGTVLTDRWSVPGGRIDFNYQRFTSALEDPLTGEERSFAGARDWSYDIDFRQDIPATPFAWGVGTSNSDKSETVRVDEITIDDRVGSGYRAFFEHKDLAGLNLRVQASNIGNPEFIVDRERYAGLRTETPIEVIERRERTANERFQVVLSGTF